MNKTLLSTAITVAIYFPLLASASTTSQQPARLETVAVVSSRIETPLRELGTSVAVMDAEAIKARGFISLADTLRSMPSVSVTNSGGMGKASSLRVRGEQGFRTLVRIDGIDISDPTGTQANAQIHHLLSPGISRVELLRGPQGMMYGADAGGVLLISTDQATDKLTGYLGAEAGRYGTATANAGIGGGSDKGDFYLSGAHAKTDGFNAQPADASSDKDGNKNTTLHARAGWNLATALRLEAVVRDTRAETEFDRCNWPVSNDCVGDFSQRNLRLGLTHTTARGDYTLAYSETDTSRIHSTGEIRTYDTEGKISRWELNGDLRLSDQHALVYGLEQRQDRVLVNERDQQGAYLEYQGRYAEQIFVTAGVRQDDNDHFGSHGSYRVSAAYLLPQVSYGALKIKTSAGTGFRAPSLYEMDYNRQQDNPALQPLNPEQSQGVDVGLEYYFPNGNRLELVVFDQEVEDEIYFDLIGFSGYMQGQQTSQSRGIEWVAEVVLTEGLNLNANYTYVDTETDAGTPRSRQPKHLTNIGLAYKPLAALAFTLNLRTAEDAVDLSSGRRLDNYQVLDASARYYFAKGISVYLRGENILDEQYVEVPGYNTAGAAAYAGVAVTF